MTLSDKASEDIVKILYNIKHSFQDDMLKLTDYFITNEVRSSEVRTQKKTDSDRK